MLLFLALSLCPAYGKESTAITTLRKAGLDECLKEALENNRRSPASRFAVQMAEARQRQAIAGYWPQIVMSAGYSIRDDEIDFLYPARSLRLPALMGGRSIDIAEQTVTVLERDIYEGSVKATWLLYDGGSRAGYNEQGKNHVAMMKEEARRTELEIIDDVKRLYWGSVLAQRLHQAGVDSLSRMEVTLKLTESLYKEGSGRVKKTDWLSNRVMVETLRSMVALLEKNKLAAQAALANTMGLPWSCSIVPVDNEMPFSPFNLELDQLVGRAYRFNPDWAKVEAGLRASEGVLKTARSGYFPKLALTGKIFKWWTGADEGLATEKNSDGWSVGIGVNVPLFSGMLTKNKIVEAKARIAKIKEEQLLLKDGIGLQVREIFLSIAAAEKSARAAKAAYDAAMENRELNTRAYQNQLVETSDVINAQLMEALMSAQYFKARYSHLALLSKLDLVVGTTVLKAIQ